MSAKGTDVKLTTAAQVVAHLAREKGFNLMLDRDLTPGQLLEKPIVLQLDSGIDVELRMRSDLPPAVDAWLAARHLKVSGDYANEKIASLPREGRAELALHLMRRPAKNAWSRRMLRQLFGGMWKDVESDPRVQERLERMERDQPY